jgi:hypothetical protein
LRHDLGVAAEQIEEPLFPGKKGTKPPQHEPDPSSLSAAKRRLSQNCHRRIYLAARAGDCDQNPVIHRFMSGKVARNRDLTGTA